MQKLNENYYNVLNVPFNATQQEIQEQYTKLAVSLSVSILLLYNLNPKSFSIF
jgi:hypothetical protein